MTKISPFMRRMIWLDYPPEHPHFGDMTVSVELYTKFTCSFCSRAKQLLSAKGAEYTEYDVTMDAAKRAEMEERAPGAHTVPQIFIDGQAIGGFDDLDALNNAGKLDAMLAGSTA